MSRHGYNELKRKTLEVFARFDKTWLNAPTWAALVGYNDRHSASPYLRRLARWGLLHCRVSWAPRRAPRRVVPHRRRMMLFRISAKGLRRLEWLRSVQDRKPERGENKRGILH